MEPVPVTATHRAYWGLDPEIEVRVFGAPDGMPNCEPCQAIVTRGDDGPVVRTPWKPNEIEVAHLAQGGTIWLSTWGGIPPHMLEVQAPAGLSDG